MKIAIIGAGNIGGSLGKVWAAHGHSVIFGVRDPNSEKTRKALAETGATVQAVSIAEAAAFGEVIAIALPWAAVRETLATMGDLSGKIIIDATNRFAAAPGDAPSAAEDIARLAPGAKVFKGFNTMGWETLLDPIFSGQPATAFVCGDDSAAKQVVIGLAAEIGLAPVDAGPLENAAAAEAVARLWVYLMRSGMGREMAFALLKR